jgi:hypothetical protein
VIKIHTENYCLKRRVVLCNMWSTFKTGAYSLQKKPWIAEGFEILNDVVLNQVLVSFWKYGGNAAGHSRYPTRRHLLVRRHGVAWPDGDAV